MTKTPTTVFKSSAALLIVATIGSLLNSITLAQTTVLPQAGSTGAAVGQNAQSLTTGQLTKIKDVLAPYKSGSLTADDAKLIKRTLRDAGIPRSPALESALTAAGFSPAKLDQLDPPPPRPTEGGPPPPKK